MALTGLEIYKHLPRTNCKDCGQATCLAFAMKVAGKQAGLDDCPHMTDEGRATLGEASAPPQRLVSFGTGDAAVETGQETAEDLRHFLDVVEHPALGVNFDPANMILYGKGDPIEAVKTLAPWIKHVHIKDATASNAPGEWGEEVPWGDGEVEGGKFIQTLDEIGFSGTLAIEREAGDARAHDIKLAVKRLGDLS